MTFKASVYFVQRCPQYWINEANKLERHLRRFSSVVVNEIEKNDEHLKFSIAYRLQSLETEFQRSFSKFKGNEALFATNSFSTSLDVADIPDELQDKFHDLRNDLSALDYFNEKPLVQLWCALCDSHPLVSEQSLRIWLPFATIYSFAGVVFLLFFMLRREHETEYKSMKIWDYFCWTPKHEFDYGIVRSTIALNKQLAGNKLNKMECH